MIRRRMLAGCEMSGAVRDAFAGLGWEAWSADVLPSETPVQAAYSCGDRMLPRIHGPERLGLKNNFHYQGDVRDLFDWNHPVNQQRKRLAVERDHIDYPETPLWDLAVMFPPCTHLALSGAVWWKKKRATPAAWRPEDWPEDQVFSVQDEAASFFMEMVSAPAPLVAVENPRGDMTRRYRAPDQYVQPHMFGDPLIKLTGIWLKGLPLLHADNPVEPLPGGRVATGGGSWRTDQRHGRGANNGHEDGKGRVNRQRERNRTLPGLARAMASQWSAFAEAQETAA
jgi:hypothetical protein